MGRSRCTPWPRPPLGEKMKDPNKLFGRVVLNTKGKERNERIKMAYEALYREVTKYTDDDRYESLMTTKLEEAAMYAQKSMYQKEENLNLKEMHYG